MSIPWWQSAVGYQIYPRSFQDSNHDGIGDLPGITQHIPDLKALGVDFLWLNPIYQSPNVDNGYDIADFQAIDPAYGTWQDFETLLTTAHANDLRVIMDLVVNHTSDQHAWFQAARQSKTSPYHDYYIWQENIDGTPPNAWLNFTGDNTWAYNEATDEWYFHLFAPEQPDLNWENAQLQTEIIAMINWWADQKIDGFRLDALSHLKKVPFNTPQPVGDEQFSIFSNNPGIEVFLQKLHATFQARGLMTVGEAGGVHADTAAVWTGPSGFMNMIFELEHQSRASEFPPKADLAHLFNSFTEWQEALNQQGWLGLYLENHDQPRSITVYGDDQPLAAKALATLLLTLRGTPFIFQGEELGMTNVAFTEPEQIDDPPVRAAYEHLVATGVNPTEALNQATSWSRDNSRTPYQWTTNGFGNSAAERDTSWLLTNPNTTSLNHANQLQEPSSVLHYYQKLLAYRKHDLTLQTGRFKRITTNHDLVFAFLRYTDEATRLMFINLSDQPAKIKLPNDIATNSAWVPAISNTEALPPITATLELAPYQAGIYEKV
ncbi:MAG: alpha-glucosidase [Lactobacillaceae bacterium]|jgi:alpha-glucosidase|nr:alpha-glucosidase [Lactobacillaceae bacterium]